MPAMRSALVTFALLAPLSRVEGGGAFREQRGIIPRDPPKVRLPHRSFQTWFTGPEPDAATLAKWMGEDPKKPRGKMMGAVNRFRAKVCWQMKDTHGEKFESFHACKKFMEEACKPGGDLTMDGDKGEISSHRGYCAEYFPEDEDAAEQELEELEAEEARKAKEAEDAKKAEAARIAAEAAAAKKAAADAKAAKDAEAAKGAKGKKAEEKKTEGAASPAPAAAGGPAPGPALPADEAWYFKNEGKDPGRFHMDEEKKLPTQGYWGRLVEHDDMETATSDWHKEQSGEQDVGAICRQHPDNAWCRQMGHGIHRHSGSGALAISMAPLLLMIVAVTGFM